MFGGRQLFLLRINYALLRISIFSDLTFITVRSNTKVFGFAFTEDQLIKAPQLMFVMQPHTPASFAPF